jgi:hypothetical protein
MSEETNRAERPRVEPEILPPDPRMREGDGWRHDGPLDFSTRYGAERGTHRIYVHRFGGRIGPFGLALGILVLGILVAVLLLAVIGAVLLWLPVIAVAFAAGVLWRFMPR